VASHWRLTEQLLEEARRFELRSACRDCFFWSEQRGECWHGWPDEGQRRWPLTRPARTASGRTPSRSARSSSCAEREAAGGAHRATAAEALGLGLQ
jgi:hypothetical protein